MNPAKILQFNISDDHRLQVVRQLGKSHAHWLMRQMVLVPVTVLIWIYDFFYNFRKDLCSGADPGIFVRGGPTFRKFWQAKAKGGRGGGRNGRNRRVVVVLSLLQKSTFQTSIYMQLYFSGGGGGGRAFLYNCKPISIYTNTDDMVVLIL